ncbi:hypothetical protein R80B4_00417 [Fibrobacteres bacterium R8-0-B4]
MEKSFWRNNTDSRVASTAFDKAKPRSRAASATISSVKPPSPRIFLSLSIAIITVLFSQQTFASWNAGLPGAIFRMPAGAWASGMGGAVSADPSYMLSWYNPAQLPFLRERRASFGGGYRSLGRAESWASYDFRVPPRVGMGASFVYRGDPSISGLYDGYYNSGEVVEEQALGSAAWTAFSAKIGVGYLAARRLSFGGAVSINYQSLPTTPTADGAIENASATSIGAVDIAAVYKPSPNLTLSASIKNLMSRNSWQYSVYDEYAQAIDEVVPPVFVLSSSGKTTLWERDLTWGAEASLFLIDGEGNYLGGPEAVAAAGAAWKFSEAITLRAGIADIELSSETAESFSPRITFGFSYALPKMCRGAVFNYAIMTDRIWAGVDQQLDVTVSF